MVPRAEDRAAALKVDLVHGLDYGPCICEREPALRGIIINTCLRTYNRIFMPMVAVDNGNQRRQRQVGTRVMPPLYVLTPRAASSIASSSGTSLVAASGYKFKDHGAGGGKKLKLKKTSEAAKRSAETNGLHGLSTL